MQRPPCCPPSCIFITFKPTWIVWPGKIWNEIASLLFRRLTVVQKFKRILRFSSFNLTKHILRSLILIFLGNHHSHQDPESRGHCVGLQLCSAEAFNSFTLFYIVLHCLYCLYWFIYIVLHCLHYLSLFYIVAAYSYVLWRLVKRATPAWVKLKCNTKTTLMQIQKKHKYKYKTPRCLELKYNIEKKSWIKRTINVALCEKAKVNLSV